MQKAAIVRLSGHIRIKCCAAALLLLTSQNQNNAFLIRTRKCRPC